MRRARTTRGSPALLLAVACAFLLLACAGAETGPAAARRGVASTARVSGIRVLSNRVLDARQRSIELTSGALGGRAVNVRVLLPAGYAAHPRRRYPVLYLLHGTDGSGADFLNVGEGEELTPRLGAILVMPDGSFGRGGGWYANWYNGGRGGAPMWETFHIGQLIPWVDRHYRTIAARRGRAIAGISMGGFGAMSYAARHPDLFTSAASFSGAVEIATDREAIDLITPEIEQTARDDGASATAIFGPRGGAHELNWEAHDPAALAGNLHGTDIRLWTGNGHRGPLDGPGPIHDVDEPRIQRLTLLFRRHLLAAHVASTLTDYGDGTHSWAYWRRDLTQYLPALAARFAHPPAAPATISYRSAADSFGQWRWFVSLRRSRPAFTTLGTADRRGFTLAGTGRATVLTPPFYRAGSAHAVRVRDARGTRTLRLRAGAGHRLRIPLVVAGRRATVRIS